MTERVLCEIEMSRDVYRHAGQKMSVLPSPRILPPFYPCYRLPNEGGISLVFALELSLINFALAKACMPMR